MGAQLTSNPNTFEKNKGNVFVVDKAGTLSNKIQETQLSNGLEWNLCADKFYFVDSLENKVFQFEYKNNDGSIRGKRIFTWYPRK